MTIKKDKLMEKLFGIYEKLPKTSQPILNKEKTESICIELLQLAKEIATVLNETESLSSWEKQHIILAVNTVKKQWLHAAIFELNLAITDDKISPDNRYPQDIIDLDYAGVIDYIDQYSGKEPDK